MTSIRVPAFAGEVLFSVGGFVKLYSESRTTAPSSFAVDGDRVYLHDPLHESVAVFDQGKPAGVVVQALDRSALDLLNYDGKLYVLANDDEVLTYASGDSKGQLRLTAQSSVVKHSSKVAGAVEGTEVISVAPIHADSLTVVNGGVYAAFDDNTQVAIAAKAAYPAFSLQVEDDSYRINGFSDAGEVVIPAFGLPSGIFELARDDRFAYFEVAESHFNSAGVQVFDYYVYKFTYAGVHVATYALAPMLDVVPNRHVLVSHGDLFQLQIDGATTRVLKLAPSQQWTRIAAAPYGASVEPSVAAAAAKAKLIKYPDLVEGAALASLNWTYKRANNGWDEDGKHPKVTDPGGVSQPHPLRGVAIGGSKSMAGVPYNWGGCDSRTTHSVSGYTSFSDGVAKKHFTGNFLGEGGRKAGTIGLDCSGFISVIYKLGSKYGTSNLGRVFEKVSRTPKGGEIRMKSGHVFGVAARRKSGNTYRLVVMEATTRDNLDRVIHQDRAESSYDNAFATYVYPNFDYQCDLRDCSE
jgi:hypothetical protein